MDFMKRQHEIIYENKTLEFGKGVRCGKIWKQILTDQGKCKVFRINIENRK
jgi:hypothetical protein